MKRLGEKLWSWRCSAYGGEWDEGRPQVCQRSLQSAVVIVWDGDAVQLAVLVQLALVGVAAQPVVLQGFLSTLNGAELLQENMAVVASHMEPKKKERCAGHVAPTCSSRTCRAPDLML